MPDTNRVERDMIDLHREPYQGDLSQAAFRESLLAVLERIAVALEENNSGQAAARELMRAMKEHPYERSESSEHPELAQTKSKPAEKPKSRSYEDYREWGERDDGSTIWQVKIDGEWVDANALESRLFEKRLKERRGH